MKKIIVIALTVFTVLSALASCSNESTSIYVISREDGSGTRSAFTELFGIVDENDNDATIGSAEKVTSTSTVITTVAGNKLAIGYISLGSLNDSVKAVSVDGISPTVENVKNGTYKVARTFNICYKEDTSELSLDFVKFILSKEGQSIINENGYIMASEDSESYTSSGLTGTITLAGSTSVAPVIDKLADAYKTINANVTINIQQSGSGAGIESAKTGACDIGMASRELKESELASLVSVKIADDGIAIIANKENTVSNLTSEQIKNIYLGKLTDWSEINK